MSTGDRQGSDSLSRCRFTARSWRAVNEQRAKRRIPTFRNHRDDEVLVSLRDPTNGARVEPCRLGVDLAKGDACDFRVADLEADREVSRVVQDICFFTMDPRRKRREELSCRGDAPTDRALEMQYKAVRGKSIGERDRDRARSA